MDNTATRSSDPSTPRQWPGLVVGLATFAWMVASFMAFSWVFDLSFDLSGDPHPPDVQAEIDYRRRIMFIVFAAGPAVIAMFAACVELRRTAFVYFLMSVILVCWLGSQASVRELFEPPQSVEMEESEGDEEGQCIPISGSDRTCPGG